MKQKVETTQEIPEIKVVNRKIGPLSSGEETFVKPWEAVILEQKGLIKPIEEYSLSGLRKRVLAEGRASDLKELPEYFYEGLTHKIRLLKKEGKSEELEEMRDSLDSLIGLRVQKILRKAVSPTSVRELPPEEQFLLNQISTLIKNWEERLDSMFEKTPKEEVGTREEGIRRSIREIVGNATNIQKQRISPSDVHT
ncbi:MAG: DNA replication complex GINS family protein [Hadesarchaea archaeon]|nr:DNA replication complex GINS family protein [Hadesarchaea archaeon]